MEPCKKLNIFRHSAFYLPKSANDAWSGTFFKSFNPKILATQPTKLTPLLSALRFSATTIEARTACGSCMNKSIVCKQETIRCGNVPPTTVSLSPRLSMTKPVSPIAPGKKMFLVQSSKSYWKHNEITPLNSCSGQARCLAILANTFHR